MDPTNDVLLAYNINGRILAPDHGYPLRSIIPGYVGGRQVKWLKKLWISKKPNESHYHIWDNRVLPSFVEDRNTVEGKAFFHHPDTACMEQVLQSVTCRPSHDEYIPLTAKEMHANEQIGDWLNRKPKQDDLLDHSYRLEGYAYNGGGMPVQRIEVSLDGGSSWRYAFRRFTKDPLRHGQKMWAWVFWYCDIPLSDLCESSEIIVRAFDSAKNPQPAQLTWNLMGMMYVSRRT